MSELADVESYQFDARWETREWGCHFPHVWGAESMLLLSGCALRRARRAQRWALFLVSASILLAAHCRARTLERAVHFLLEVLTGIFECAAAHLLAWCCKFDLLRLPS